MYWKHCDRKYDYRATVLTGRITGLVRPSVRLSVCPPRAQSSKLKGAKKPTLVWTFPGQD